MSQRRLSSNRHARFFRLGAIAALGALAAGAFTRDVVASPAAAAPATSASPAFVTLPRNVHPYARPENDLGRLDATKRLANLAIHFKPTAAQQRDRDALVEALTDPSSPEYHQWLTPDAYAARFGAKRADIARTVAWLKSQGFDTVDDSSRLGLRVTFAGTVAQVESAFHAEMHRYQVGDEIHYAMASAPSVPADLASSVLAVYNTHDFYAKPMLRMLPGSAGLEPRPDVKCPSGSPLLCPTATTVIAPPDWKTIYNVPSTYDGTGVTVMVVGVAPFALGDVQAYRTKFLPSAGALNVTSTVVPNTGAAGETQAGAAVEAILDVEWSSSIAPGASINYVETGANDGNVFDAVYYAIEQNYGGILSVSFGGSEQGLGTSIDADVLGQYGAAANVLGITFLAASGDAAATTGERGQNPAASADGLYVSFPASMPGVTAVGGTELPASNTANFDSSGDGVAYSASTLEQVWSEGTDPTSTTGVVGGGGGISIVFPRPSYQTLAAAPACTPVGSLPVSGVSGATYRQVPDVAFSAAEGLSGAGILIECTFTTAEDCAATAGTEKFIPIGGTSASTPAFAGVIALANQAGGGRLGNVNTLLYQLPAATFHDITVGNNEAKCASTAPGCPSGGMYGYAAGTGYDCASGLGSVDATAFVGAVKAAAATTTTLGAITSPLDQCDQTPLTATVTGSGTLTGTVTFAFQSYLANGAPDLSWTIGTAAVSGGAASSGALTIPSGMVGSGKGVDVVAEYGGDPTHLPSTSPKVHVTFTPAALCVTEGTVTTTAGATVNLVANGGAPPLRWYLSQDTTASPTTGAGGSSIDESTGVLTAGTSQAGFVLVSVLDSAGAETFVEVTVGSPTGSPSWEADGGYVPSVCSGTVPDAGACTPGTGSSSGGSSSGSSSGGSGSGGSSSGSSSGGSSSGGSGSGSSSGTISDDAGTSAVDAGSELSDNGSSSSSGCSCDVAGSGGSPFGIAGAIALGLGLVARRRRRED